MAFPYPNQRYTTNLGLSLFGMDEVLADNMNLLDQAYGAGSSINVNGTLVESPNLNNTTPAAPAGKTNVIWQVDVNGNISAYASGGGGSTPGGPTNSIQYNAAGTLGGLAGFEIAPASAEVTIKDTAPSATNLAALSLYANAQGDNVQNFYEDGSAANAPDFWVDAGVGLNWKQDANIAAGRSVSISAGGSGRTQIAGIQAHLFLDATAIGVFDLNNGLSTAYVRSDNVGTLTLLGNNGVGIGCGATLGKVSFSSAFTTGSDMNLQSTITDGYGQTGTTGQLLSSDGAGRIQWVPAGFTNPMTTLGDIIYENATPAAARLAGNITTTKKYLSQTGNGSISAAPVWAQIAAVDLSNGVTGTGAVVLASAIAGFGSGTVTSVAMTGDGVIFNASVTGSPITTAGTLAPSLLTQAKNTFLSGPASGANAAPTFRTIGAGDIPTGTVTWDQIGSAAGNLSLSNSTFNSTFNQTTAAIWTYANTTAATNSATAPALVSSQFISAAGTGGQANGSAISTIGATLLVAVMSGFGGSPTMVDGQGNTWNYTPMVTNGSLNLCVGYAFSKAGGALSTSASCTFTGSSSGSSWTAAIYAFSGTLTTSAVYDSAVGVVSNIDLQFTPMKIGVITPTAGDIVFTNITNGSNVYTASSIDSGFTGVLNGAQNGATAAYLLNATGAPISPTWTFTPVSANASIGQLACFKSASTVVPQGSPIQTLSGTYWNGAASATDSWTLQDKVTTGPNGLSQLLLTHTGSSGPAALVAPGLLISDTAPNVDLQMMNTTAATAAGVNQNSPVLSLAGQFFINGATQADSWTLQNVIAASFTSATVTNIVENASSGVTLTITGGASFVALATGTYVTFTGLTTGTWLNGQTVQLLTATSVQLTFQDPTLHSTQASHAETGTVTQTNPLSILAIQHLGSAQSAIQIPAPNAKLSSPTIIAQGGSTSGIAISPAPSACLTVFANGSATYITFNNGGGSQGSISGQVTSASLEIQATGTGGVLNLGTTTPSATGTVPQISLGHNQASNWVTTGSGPYVGVNLGTKYAQGGDNSPWINWLPTFGSGNLNVFQISPTINQAAINNTPIGSALVTNVGAVVFSTANAFTASGLVQLTLATNTALNGTQTLVAQAQRAGSPYTITNSVENAGSTATLTVGTHAVAVGDWIFVTGLTTATWLNGQTVKVTAVVANSTISFVDLTTHGTSATHADTGTIACNYFTFSLTHANITGSADSGTALQQSTGLYTALLINPTETAVAPGAHRLIDMQVGGTSQATFTDKGILSVYNAEATAGVGTGYMRGSTTQKAETGADASVLSVTPASVAGLYRIAIVLSVSAASAATLGWTATWKDSNGNAQAPTNLSLSTPNSATLGLTVSAAANATYYGEWYVDVNNAGTAIVVKTTFSGTSIAYKASATIERMQ